MDQKAPLICFDLDGTLLDRQGRIHPKDLQLLSEARVADCLIPATGRPLESVRRTFAANGLFVHQPLPLALVLQNGSLLYAAGEVRLAYAPFDAELQTQLIRLARAHPEVTFLFLDAEQIHALWPSHFGMQEAERFEFSTREFTAQSAGCTFSKLMCLSSRAQPLKELARAVESLSVEAALSMPTLLEITPRGVDKGTGLQKLLRLSGWEGRPIYAAGDGENDLPLFALARRSYAPDDAPSPIQRRASHVLHVYRDGLLGPILEAAARSTGSGAGERAVR